MNITLTPDIEHALVEEARQRNTTPEMLTVEYLKERLMPLMANEIEAKEGETLADFLAGYIGVLSSSERIPAGARMSEDSGKKFALASGETLEVVP
jgi:hypothetical protein